MQKLFTALFLMTAFFIGCGGKSADVPYATTAATPAVSPDAVARPFASFREIPNITEEEIAVVEYFKDKERKFSLGVLEGSEAFTNIDGENRGFVAHLTNLLSDLFGITFEFTLTEWDDIIAGLANGNVDFTPDLTPTEERRKIYHMTDPITVRSVKIFRMAESVPIEEIARERMLRYGFLVETVTGNDVREVSELPFDAVAVNTLDDALQFLREGKIDAFFEENTSELFFLEHDDVTAEYFFPLILSEIAFTTQNDSLAPFISIFQKFIENGGNEYLNFLRKQGYRDFRKNRFMRSLSANETAFLRNMTDVRFLAEYDNYPTSFFNTRENEWQGIAFDILREIEVLTGFGFTVANDRETPYYTLIQMLAEGGGQMISELAHGADFEENFISANNSHTTDYLALLSRSDMRSVSVSDILDLRVGAVRGMFAHTMFNRWFPSHTNLVEYDDAVALFNDLDKGKIDLAMSTRNQLLYLTNYLELPGFKVNYQFGHEYRSSYGFARNEEMLRDIVDKALREIDREAIALRWYHKTYDYRIKQAEERMQLFLWMGILLLCLCVLTIAVLIARRTGKRLERAVALRTAELNESNIKLERASRMKSEFLARTSHEIRTPMNVIIGISQIALRENIRPESVRDHIITIKHASENLISIINDLLDITKIESGNIDLVCTDYDFGEFIKNIVNVIDLRVVGTNVRFSVNVDSGIPKILHGDELKIRRVLLNILSNAVKYTAKGSITLNIEGERENEESDTVILAITVADTGIGVKKEDVKKLFGDFVRLDDAINSNIEGTGLGLAISKQLLTAMGGEITVASTYGKGTVFSVSLPQKIGSAKTLAAPRKPQSENENAAPFIAPLAKILIVDDIKANLDVAKGLLSIYEMQIDTVQSGADALEHVKEAQYDLILLDLMMPQMDGEETLENIRALAKKHPYLETVPVIALTAVALPEVRDHLLKSGFCEVLVKPIDMEKLNAALEKYIIDDKRIDGALITDDRRAGDDRRSSDRSEDRPDRRRATDENEYAGVSDEDIRIEGINVGLGIYNAGGKPDWYLRTLEIFCDDVLDKAKFMKSALAMKDLRLYKTSVESLINIASNVGAISLSVSAKRLEEAATAGDMQYLCDHNDIFLTDVLSTHQRVQSALIGLKRR